MARKYDHEYKVQAVKLAKEIGGAKAAKELGIPEGTIRNMQTPVISSSFPSWERGLKLWCISTRHRNWKSFPSWERGLKLDLRPVLPARIAVVPLVGTWIETSAGYC